MKQIYLIAILFATAAIIASCENDDEDYIKKSDIEKSQGKIEVTLDGETRSAHRLDDVSYSLTKYSSMWSNFFRIDEDGSTDTYNFSIYRTDDAINGTNSCELYFTWYYNHDDYEQNVLYCDGIYLNYEKELPDGEYLDLSIDAGGIEINNFEFDRDTYRLTGSFSYRHEWGDSYYNDYDGDNIDIDIEFDVTPKKVIKSGQ